MPLILDKCISIQFETRNGCSQRRLAIDLDLFCKTTRELADKAEEKGDLLPWFDHGGIVMTVEFALGIFKSILIDFLVVFEVELNIDS